MTDHLLITLGMISELATVVRYSLAALEDTLNGRISTLAC